MGVRAALRFALTDENTVCSRKRSLCDIALLSGNIRGWLRRRKAGVSFRDVARGGGRDDGQS